HGNVFVVAMHEIDVDMVGLHALKRLRELPADLVGVVERGVNALADQHKGVALDAATPVPLAEERIAAAATILPGRVDQNAAAPAGGIKQDGGVADGGAVPTRRRDFRGRLADAAALGFAERPRLGPLERGGASGQAAAPGSLFESVFEAGIGPPFVE